MAQKGGYPGGAPPPPYMYPQGAGGPPPPAYYPPAHTTVVIQQQQPQYKPKTNHGLFGAMSKELNAMGNMIQREMEFVGGKIDQEWKKHNTGPVLNNFSTGNQIQLVSKASGMAVQIVQAANGQLVVDGCGAIGQGALNAIWTVVNEGNNQIRLHNNHNYLCVANGHTTLIHMPPGVMHGIETKLQLNVKANNFVTVESMKERGKHIGILNNGALKPALATGEGDHGQFGINLIASPYPQAGKK